ncbi:hypothetical protein Tco_1261045 [Tanacetum coccineum]
MLQAMKDEAGGNLNEEENDFMLDNAYGDDTLEELNAAVIMIACIQPPGNKADAEQKHDAETINEVNDSQIDPISGMRLKVIIFNDPYVDNNGGIDEHASNAQNQSVSLESLIYNVQEEAKNQRRLNNELNKQNALL